MKVREECCIQNQQDRNTREKGGIVKRRSIVYISFSSVVILLAAVFLFFNNSVTGEIRESKQSAVDPGKIEYRAPSFYRGIYLSNDTACSPERFRAFADEAQKSHINALVMDVQTSRYRERMVPAAHVEHCLARNIHPIARIVVFPGGITKYPPDEEYLNGIIDTAERAARSGFREIQLDYIRFSDENRHEGSLRNVALAERHAFIERFLTRVKARLSPYRVKIAADVFGRIPHNTNDRIGQNMEVFDRHVDVICPMAYPSHYWTKRLRHDPYGTVLWTSTEACRRTGKAEIVTWIQAFKMQHPPGMCFIRYIELQIKAVHDAKAKGFLLWNARQDYSSGFKAVKAFYGSRENDGLLRM